MKQKPGKRVAGAAALLAGLLLATVGLGQESGEGVFIDGEYVENYVYVPEFMPPEELLGLMEEGSDSVVIVDTAAELIFEDEHIPGAVNYPWVHNITPPVPLPRDKTLVIYCACNDHEDSVDMAEKLSHVGYYNVKVLEGGWFKWLDLGYETAGLAVEEAE